MQRRRRRGTAAGGDHFGGEKEVVIWEADVESISEGNWVAGTSWWEALKSQLKDLK